MMAITLSGWITVDKAAGDLTTLVPKLAAYADLAQHWPAIAAER